MFYNRFSVTEAKKMTDKCSKYESIFTFRTEEELNEHIKNCPECAEIHEKMQKVSALIQEVKPHYEKRGKFASRVAACIALFLMISGTTIGLIKTNPDISDTLMYGTTLSAEDLGFPVDSYGLISVE